MFSHPIYKDQSSLDYLTLLSHMATCSTSQELNTSINTSPVLLCSETTNSRESTSNKNPFNILNLLEKSTPLKNPIFPNIQHSIAGGTTVPFFGALTAPPMTTSSQSLLNQFHLTDIAEIQKLASDSLKTQNVNTLTAQLNDTSSRNSIIPDVSFMNSNEPSSSAQSNFEENFNGSNMSNSLLHVEVAGTKPMPNFEDLRIHFANRGEAQDLKYTVSRNNDLMNSEGESDGRNTSTGSVIEIAPTHLNFTNNNRLSSMIPNTDILNKEQVPITLLKNEPPNYYYYLKCYRGFCRQKKQLDLQKLVQLKMNLMFEKAFCKISRLQPFRRTDNIQSSMRSKIAEFARMYPEDNDVIRYYMQNIESVIKQMIHKIRLSARGDMETILNCLATYAAKEKRFIKLQMNPITFNDFIAFCKTSCRSFAVYNSQQNIILIYSFLLDVTNPGYDQERMKLLSKLTNLDPAAIVKFFNDALKQLKLDLFQHFYYPETNMEVPKNVVENVNAQSSLFDFNIFV